MQLINGEVVRLTERQREVTLWAIKHEIAAMRSNMRIEETDPEFKDWRKLSLMVRITTALRHARQQINDPHYIDLAGRDSGMSRERRERVRDVDYFR